MMGCHDPILIARPFLGTRKLRIGHCSCTTYRTFGQHVGETCSAVRTPHLANKDIDLRDHPTLNDCSNRVISGTEYAAGRLRPRQPVTDAPDIIVEPITVKHCYRTGGVRHSWLSHATPHQRVETRLSLRGSCGSVMGERVIFGSPRGQGDPGPLNFRKETIFGSQLPRSVTKSRVFGLLETQFARRVAQK